MTAYTRKQFDAEYPNDGACLERLMEVQYGGSETVCIGCGEHTKFHLMKTRKAYACQECGHHIYPCAGTIFHKSRTKLTDWFFVMYLMTSTRHGVAAAEVQRQLNVTYKTAWRMCHELRKLMASADHGGMLSGHIEIDETYVGGREKQKDIKNKGSKKTVILGKHSAGEYVRGIHHTNTIESHWGHFKRSVAGTHVTISQKHMWKYIAEFTYRRNYRLSHSGMFNRLVAAFALPRLQEP